LSVFFLFNTCTRNDLFEPINPALLPPKEVPILEIHKNFLMQESSNKHYRKNGEVRISHKGAVGRWQVTPIGIKEYNRCNKNVKFGSNGLRVPYINAIIGKWILKDNIKHFSEMGHDKYISILLGINAYNHGKQGTIDGNIAHKYLSNIVPSYYNYYIAKIKNKEK
jgi:hypothetical protein